ncbi:MAG: hypothetical protein V1706_15625 [Pseudomonadota bacterium]
MRSAWSEFLFTQGSILLSYAHAEEKIKFVRISKAQIRVMRQKRSPALIAVLFESKGKDEP